MEVQLFWSHSGTIFNPFGITHLAAGGIAIGLWSILLLYRCKFSQPVFVRFFKITLTLTGLGLLFSFYSWIIFWKEWNVRWSLPLELCDLSFIAALLSLWIPSRWLKIFTIFPGTGSALLAFITPALSFDFPHVHYLFFFFEHGITLTVSLYWIAIGRFRPEKSDLFRSFMFLNSAALGILFLNLFLKSNYFFLMNPPPSPSLFSWLGPWPFYWLSCEGIAILIFSILFLILRRINPADKKS
jgi:hypothetical integral membrane protein (TIGR02206 family)